MILSKKIITLITATLLFYSTSSFADARLKDDETSMTFYLGTALLEIETSPIATGFDYKFALDDVDFFKNWNLMIGGLVWRGDAGFVNYTVFEVGAGMEKSYDLKSLIFNMGFRSGIARFRISTKVPIPLTGGTLDGVTISTNELFVSGHVGLKKPINDASALGLELRLPIYFRSGFQFTDTIYALLNYEYRFL